MLDLVLSEWAKSPTSAVPMESLECLVLGLRTPLCGWGVLTGIAGCGPACSEVWELGLGH